MTILASTAIGERRCDARDLAGARKKDEHVAGVARRARRRSRRATVASRRACARGVDVARLDGKRATFARDDRRVAEERRDGGSVERRRHDGDAKIVAHERLRAKRQREAEVGVDAALVELVEDEKADAVERRVVLQAPREDAFGDDLDARRAADARVAAHAIADRLADALAVQLGEPEGGGARRESPRLEHDDRAPVEPAGVEEGERNGRGFAGAGRRLNHDRRGDERARRRWPEGSARSAARCRGTCDALPITTARSTPGCSG